MDEQAVGIKQSAYQIEMDKAWDLFNGNQIDPCMEICQALILEYPDKSGCHNLLGHVFRIKEEYKACVEHLELALGLDDGKNAGYIYYWLGEVYGKSGWLEDEDKYVYDSKKSEDNYKSARECEQYPPDLLLVMDYNLTDQEKIETYELGIKKFPDLPDFYFKLARHYGEFGLSEMQIQTLQRALGNKLTSSLLFYNIGYFYFKKGDFKLAEKFLSDALEHNTEYTGYSFAINYLLGKVAETFKTSIKLRLITRARMSMKRDIPTRCLAF